MPYRRSADETAPATSAATRLLRLDAAGHDGANGARGRDGAPGSGAPGSDASSAAPGANGGKIVVALSSDTRDGIAHVKGEVSARSRASAPIDVEIAFDRPGMIELVALGGDGGDGGDGGRGGDGATGLPGSDATRFSSGSNGGPGGDGGHGGNGSHGANGGRGGDVTVRVHDRDTHLLMLIAHDVRGGSGGRAGRNGPGGSGGRGGRGGSSYSWTTTETYVDAEGRSQSRTKFHSNPGGSTGPSGRSGFAGTAALRDGARGAAGTFLVEVSDDRGRVSRADSRYDVRLVSFRHRNANDDGIYEPEEQVFVGDLEVENTGGMPLPAHHDVIVRVIDDGWIAPKDTRLVLPRSLAPGQRHLFTDRELELALRLFRPQATGGPLAAPETIRLVCELPSVRRSFGAFASPATDEMGRIVVRFPIELSPVRSLFSLSPGQAARVRWSITNASEKTFGLEGEAGRAVGVRLRLEGGELGEDDVLFVDPSGTRRSLRDGYEVDVPAIGPKKTATFEGTIAIAPHARPYACVRLVASAELGHVGAPSTTRPIQLQELTIRVGQPKDEGDADVLLVTNNRTTDEEVEAWRAVHRDLGLSMSIWDASLEGGMSVLTEVAARERAYRAVVVLDDVMDTAVGTRHASALIGKETVHAVTRADTHVLYIGPKPPLDELAVPSPAGMSFEVHRWYLSPWATPSEAQLEARAEDVAERLRRRYPDRRWVVVWRFAPEVKDEIAWARRVRLGTIEVRRTFARGAITEVVAGAEDLHRASFVRDDATYAALVHALPFATKLALLERGGAYGARTPKLAGGIEDVLAAAVVADLAHEQRAIAPHVRASRAELLRRMPLLRAFTDAERGPPGVTLESAAGKRLVEIAAWLDFIARGHARWFDWIPPLPLLRRGPRLRGAARSALARLVFADPDAARKAIARRRKQIARARKETLLRPLDFALDRVEAGLAGREVRSDAQVVPAARVLTHDELAAIAKADAKHASRARKTIAASAAARAEMLQTTGYAELAVRARVEVAPPIRVATPELEEEDDDDDRELADAGDLAALREQR
ncbi:MAG: hypothetical protein KIT84_11725 [Labilithrix sp.]|nr:hypothetical protein [Labilithrix sp.]MCW5811679.1 hypothetical protein [Labilithrix sp.]